MAHWQNEETNEDSNIIATAEAAPTVVDSSDDDDRNLIDRQFETDCPHIWADHNQAVQNEGVEKVMTQCVDIWDADAKDEWPCPTRASSLDTFAQELFKVAEECSLAPRRAHVADWQGSPWRSITPHHPHSTLKTSTTTEGQKPTIIDLSDDTDQDESFDDSKKMTGHATKKAMMAKWVPKQARFRVPRELSLLQRKGKRKVKTRAR